MKILKTGKEARQLLKNGVDAIANSVKFTIGPSGRTSVIGRKFQDPLLCDDGVTLSNSLSELEGLNEIEWLGVQMAQHAGRLTEKKVEDGTSSTIVMLQSMVQKGFDIMNSGSNLVKKLVDPIEVREEITKAVEEVCAEIDKMAIPVKTLEESEKVAFTSSKDKRVSRIVSEVFDKIGKDGVVTIEDGDFDIESEIIDGFEIQAGFHSPRMANQPTGECVLNSPRVLVTYQHITRAEQLQSIITDMIDTKTNDIVIIAPHFSTEVLSDMLQMKHGIAANINGTLVSLKQNILPIKPPFFASKERFEDIAIKTGGVFFDSESETKLEDAKVSQLGSIKKIIADKNRCVIMGGKGDTKERITVLREELKKTKGAYEKEKIQSRIASLANGIGIIRVGADTDLERENIKHKVKDCIGSVRNALKSGYVIGGGQALKQISGKLSTSIISDTLNRVYNQLQENAGGKLKISKDCLDAAEVIKVSLRNACEIAGNIITTEIAVNDKYESDKKENK